MKFYYDIIETKMIDVDFQKIYDFIKNEDFYNSTLEEIYDSFVDNVGYCLRSIYDCDDLMTWDNEENIHELIVGWENWLESTFGNIWE